MTSEDKMDGVVEEVVVINVDATKAHQKIPPKPKELHTKNNTTVKDKVPSVWKTEEYEGKNPSELTIFLGTKKEDFTRNGKMLSLWVSERSAAKLLAEGKVAEASYAPIKEEFDNYRNEHYSHLDDDQFEAVFNDFLRFNQDLVEQHSFKSDTNYTREYTNMTKFADQLIEKDVVPRLGGAGNSKMSYAERMERSFTRNNNSPMAYDVLIRDSFVQLRIKRTTILEQGDLINEISKEIRGYVRRVNGNSLSLSRVAMQRVFWEHVMSKIVSTSVKGLTDNRNLGSIIRYNHLNEIVVKYIEEVSPRGIPFVTYCANGSCGWQDNLIIDPSLLKHHDSTLLTSEQAAALGNIRNGVVKYSKEEIGKLQKQFDLVEDDRIYFDNGRSYITISPCTVNQAFIAYDIFIETMQPRIDEIRAEHLDNAKYLNALENLLTQYRSMEFIHWADKLVIINDDGEDEVFSRDEDAHGFFTYLIKILNDPININASIEFIKKIHANASKFTTTVIGVPNYTCPKCKKSSGEHTGVHGITPIDAFSCFFILSRMKAEERLLEIQEGTKAI